MVISHIQIGVKALLKNPEGKYLLIRRSSSAENGAGKWDIPGGRMEVGSTTLENLAREVMEETGLVMTSQPVVLGMHDLMWPDRQVVRIAYSGTIDGTPRLSHEHSEYRWASLHEILSLKTEEFDTLLRALFEENAELLG